MKRRQFVQGVGASAVGLQWAAPAAAFATERKQMPLEAFIDGPLFSDYVLSPDGKRMAMVVNAGDKSQIVVRDLATGAMQGVMQTDNLEYLVSWIQWKTNNRLLTSLLYPVIRDLGPGNRRIETLESRLFAVDADGSNLINMVKSRQGFGQQMKWAWSQDRVIDFLPDDANHVLMELPDGDQFDSGYAIYKVNITTAERSLHQAPRDGVSYVCTDSKHQVRVGWESGRYDAKTTLWVCDPDGNRWRKLAVDKGPYDESSITPMGFGLDPNILFVGLRVNGLVAVHTMDLREESPKPVLKLADPDINLTGSLIRDGKGEVVGVRGVDSGTGSSRFYWDKGYKDLQDQLDEALPKRWNSIVDISRFNGRYLLSSTVPGLPASLMLGNLVTGKLEGLGSQYADLDPQRIARKRHFKFKARDGFELHAFLTLPLDVKAEKLPLVALPHGGPQAQDTERFDSLVAFIADRGYAVLQVNFRGSTGYGWDYMKAGLRRCGLETQDDVTDGVKKLVADGVADPARLAIVGWSFGGYAALNGVVKDPDLYRGAFAIAPVSNLIDAVSWRFGGSRETVRAQIGDPRDDADQLRATSPVFFADRIKVPVVLAHGKLDRQAEFSQSVQMDEALTKAGKAHKFIVFEKGDHSLTHRPYRRQLYGELESFLKSTLGPGAA